MPTYGYRCEKNGHEFEVFQAMTEAPLQRCPTCRSKVRRIFYPVGIVFKGEGFYATDSRKKSTASSTAPSDKPAEKSETKATAAKPESKPGKAKAGDSK